MSTAPTGPYSPPAALVGGAVRASHILFLYIVIFTATSIMGYKLGLGADPQWRFAWQSLLCQMISGSMVVILSLVVPELRRSLPFLYAPSRAPISGRDALLFLAVMLSWAYGAYRVLFVFPLLREHPELASSMGYYEHFPEVGAIFLLLWSVSSGLIAPFFEELLFRGYLQNLWRHRWGTWPAVLLSALVFGLSHLQFAVFAMVAGIFLSLIYLRTGSLWPGTLLHGLYNLVVAPFVLGRFFSEKNAVDLTSVSHWIPELILTVAFFPLLYFFWRRFRPQT
jgi:membrane protease YdiL (CAAX protease family)